MDSLIDTVQKSHWENPRRKADGYVEYHVMRNHKILGPHTMGYMISDDDGNSKNVELEENKNGKDPLKNIGKVEIKLNEDGTKVLGIDLDGDCVQRKIY